MLDQTVKVATIFLECTAGRAQESIARALEGVLIASPYLTSDTAENVIGAADPSTATILTTFRAKTFADGASCLQTLRNLIEKGYRLRYLDDLHAKIIFTSDICLLGSQNLTVAGTQNKEATAIIKDAAAIKEARETLDSWLALSQPITLEMLKDMENLVGPLLKKAEELESATDVIDEEVRKSEETREQERERFQQEEEERERELRRLKLLATLEQAHAPLQASVQKAPIQGAVWLNLELGPGAYYVDGAYTLLASQGADLTNWSASYLEKRRRYLLIAPEIGKLGWPALNKTRLTRFGVDLKPSHAAVSIGGVSWPVEEISFNEELETLIRWNARFTLRIDRQLAAVHLLTKFTLEDLELVDISEAPGNPNPKAWIATLASEFESYSSQLRRELLSPFKYRSNRRGVLANKFCEGLPGTLRLRLRKHMGQPFFSLESN